MASLLTLVLSGVVVATEADRATLDALAHKDRLAGGLIVHLGCGNGRLTTKLATRNQCRVHGLDSGGQNVAAANDWVRGQKLSARVWIDRHTADRLPYAENMVNLCVIEDLDLVPREEIDRVLVPGGISLTRSGDGWKERVKPWPKNIDQWTHWLHGPDGNAVADDHMAGPPRRFKWIAEPFWSRSHDTPPSVTSMVSAGGRLFAIVDEAPASMSGAAPDNWWLVARDAFNGMELWRRPIDEWGWRSWATQYKVRFTVPTHMPRRLVAVGDRVYATRGFNAPLVELDARTGETLRTFEGTENTDEILCVGDTLIVAVNQGPQGPGDKAGDSPPPVKKWVVAIDRSSGEMKWKTGDYVGLRSKTGPMERISHLSMVAGDDRVCFVDGNQIVCLNLNDGSRVWRVPRPEVDEHRMRYDIRITDMCSLVYHDGVVFFAQLDPDRRIDWREIRGKVHAFSAETGQELWNRECSSWGWGHPADVFVIDDLVWVSGFKDDFYFGLNRQTGEVKRKVSNAKAFDNGHHHRCYRNKATQNFLMTSFRGLEFIDLNSAAIDRNHWVRGTCRLGAMPCNGMVYATPHPCDCYITSKLNGFLGLLPAASNEPPEASASRLQKGPAYGAKIEATAVQPEDWPTYRHDVQRSGRSAAAVPDALGAVWQVDFGQRLTSPVVAEGRVVVALADCRQVVALDAASGTEQWRFTAGGSIDTPPTMHEGRVLFGAADGYAYCLRADDGESIWRFRAAPHDRIVSAFGRLESAWPVHGSILVRDDTAYFTAGRSSLLDGGIFVWALDVETGDVVAQERIRTEHDLDVDWGRDQTVDTGVLSDLLVAHDGGIYLRHRPLLGTEQPQRMPQHLRASAGMLDESWFHRTRWFLGGVPLAEYLVFDETGICGVRARQKVGASGGHFTPGTNGFELFSVDLVEDQPRKPPRVAGITPRPPLKSAPTPRGGSDTPKVRGPQNRWSIQIATRPTAMVLAGDTLLVAGTPDELPDNDPWAAYEGRRGGMLLVVSTADGKIRVQKNLDAPPILDGMALAGERLYMSTTSGQLLCLGAAEAK